MTDTTPSVAARAHGPWRYGGKIKLVGDLNSRAGGRNMFCGRVTLKNGEHYRGEICFIQSADHIEHGIGREEAHANARLIAAAPDLLAAPKECEAYFDERADADQPAGSGPIPNDEMRLLTKV